MLTTFRNWLQAYHTYRDEALKPHRLELFLVGFVAIVLLLNWAFLIDGIEYIGRDLLDSLQTTARINQIHDTVLRIELTIAIMALGLGLIFLAFRNQLVSIVFMTAFGFTLWNLMDSLIVGNPALNSVIAIALTIYIDRQLRSVDWVALMPQHYMPRPVHTESTTVDQPHTGPFDPHAPNRDMAITPHPIGGHPGFNDHQNGSRVN